MDDDVDIYADLPSFDANDCPRCKEKFKESTEKNVKLEEDSVFWKLKFQTLDDEKKTIVTNTSSLMKTARAEIDRKDRIIMELRRELEDLKFKRGVWSGAKTNYPESRIRGKPPETKRNNKELPAPRISGNDEPARKNIFEDDEDEPEQKWEPNGQTGTVYGERLRRKILLEQEAERIRREETKILATNGPTISSRDPGKQPVTKSAEVPAASVKTLSVDGRTAGANNLDENEEDEPGEKWDVDRQNYTANGENRGRKIQLEQEAKRIQREEENFLASNGPLRPVKIERETNEENEIVGYIVKSEVYQNDETFEDSREEAALLPYKNFEYNSASLHSSEYDYKSRRNVDRRYDESSSTRDERRRNNDFYRHDGNLNRDIRYDLSHKTRYDHRSINDYPRNRQIHEKRSKSNYRSRSKTPDLPIIDFPRNRQIHEKRSKSNYRSRSKTPDLPINDFPRNREIYQKQSKSNYRSRSKTPDRRYNGDKKYEKYRTEKYRDRSEKYEKLYDDRSSRDRYNYTVYNNNDIYDLRDRLERRFDDKYSARSDYDNYGNYYHKRRGKSRSPTEKSRSRSSGTRSSHNDGRRNERSASRGRLLVDTEIKREFEKERDDKERGSKDRKIVSIEENYCHSEILSSDKTELLRKNSVQDSTSSLIISEEPQVLHAEVNISNVDEIREESMDNIEAASETLMDLLNQVEARDKFIFMLENDSELPSSPSTRSEILPIGSLSFREEKIENIEKFIQDYRHEETHCTLLGNEESLEFVNTTSSIVDTLSMDIEDVVAVNQFENGIIENSVYSLNVDIENVAVDENLEQDAIDEDLKEDAVNEKLEILAIDEKMKNIGANEKLRDISVDKQSEDVVINEKMKAATIDEKLKKVVIDDKSGDVIADEQSGDGAIDDKLANLAFDEKSRDVEIDKKLEEIFMDEKTKDLTIDEKLKVFGSDVKSKDAATDTKIKDITPVRNVATDEKTKIVAIDEKSKDSAIDKKTQVVTIKEKLEDIGDNVKSRDTAIIVRNSNDISLDERSKNVSIHERSEKVTTDVKLKDVAFDDKLEDVSLDNKSKNVAIDGKSKNIAINEKLNDIAIDCKSKDVSLDTNSKNLTPDEKLKDLDVDTRSRNATINHKFPDISLDERSKNVTIDEKLENFATNVKSKKVSIVESHEKTILRFAPPLPPSPQLAPLPPLPPCPPPEEKEPEIPVCQKISTVKPDSEISQTEKVVPKQTKKRPRIPCLPIVSLYSRKRRDFVLTDSVSSHTIVSSLNSAANEIVKEKLKISRLSEIDQKTAPKPIKPTKSSKLKEIHTDISTSESIICKTEKKTVSENLIKVSNTCGSKNIVPSSKNENSVIECIKTEDSSSNVVTFNDDKKFKNDVPVVSSLSRKNIVTQKWPKDLEKIVEKCQPEVEIKKSSKSKNSDKIVTTKDSTFAKSTDRVKRSALKTIASMVSSSDAGSPGRKRHLSKEKENQSKPVKQAKIMMIARRRPVQLEDSSTSTTLVSSEHEDSSRDNSHKSSGKIDVSRKKRREPEQ